jgi:DNA-binding transcriptional regulator WhiA
VRAAAKARLENPDATLQELAEMLGISKSGMNHRMRKLKEIAEQLEAAIK